MLRRTLVLLCTLIGFILGAAVSGFLLALLFALVGFVACSILLGGDENYEADEIEGNFCCEVVGESFYQKNFTKICGRKKRDGEHRIVAARLVPDDNNPHDKNAVRIEVDGLQVGNLSRDAAKVYRSKHSGPNDCRGLIVGGWRRGGGDTGSYGIRLEFDL